MHAKPKWGEAELPPPAAAELGAALAAKVTPAGNARPAYLQPPGAAPARLMVKSVALSAARARGQLGGRPNALTPKKAQMAKALDVDRQERARQEARKP